MSSMLAHLKPLWTACLCVFLVTLPVPAPANAATAGARRGASSISAYSRFAVLLPAATYYVDQSNPAASDSNPGTAGLPWLTIGRAANTLQAGDTVIVKPGTYPERVVPQNSGAPGAAITFRAEPSRSVTMYGFDTVNASYLRIQGFNITTIDALSGWTEGYGVFVRSDHVEVLDNYFYDLKTTAIQGYWHDPYPQDAHIAGNKIYHSQMGIGITGSDWLVEDNEVERLFNYGGGDSDYSRFFGDDHVIRHNYFHGTDFSEIGSAHVDCFQTFDNNGESGHNILFDGNTCADFHQGLMGEAIYYHDISHLTFRNNVFMHGGAWGLCINDLSDITVVNNTFSDIQYHGIGMSGSQAKNLVVENNIFYNTGTSYWFPDGSGSWGDHNLVYQSQDPPVAGAHDLIGVDPRFVDAAKEDFHLLPGSPAIDAGASLGEVASDHDGAARPYAGGWDIGAFEFRPLLSLQARSMSASLRLDWQVNAGLPLTTTWSLAYDGPPGDQASPIEGLPYSTRSYTLSGLTDGAWYTLTLSAVQSQTVVLSDTLRAMPSAQRLALPVLMR
jgi:hypothetical protein